VAAKHIENLCEGMDVRTILDQPAHDADIASQRSVVENRPTLLLKGVMNIRQHGRALSSAWASVVDERAILNAYRVDGIDC
jgi:hypothetical protein